jgi:flagellar hook-length control protein FliK
MAGSQATEAAQGEAEQPASPRREGRAMRPPAREPAQGNPVAQAVQATPAAAPDGALALDAEGFELRVLGEARLGVSAASASASGAGLPGAPVPPAQAQAAIAQVAVAIRGAAQDRIEIRLDPPELGRVRIEMRLVDGTLQALVTTERPEVQDLMRRNAEILRAELEAAGYEGVSLGFAGGEAAGERAAGEQAPRESAARDGGRGSGEPVTLLAAAPAVRAGMRDGRLDIRL